MKQFQLKTTTVFLIVIFLFSACEKESASVTPTVPTETTGSIKIIQDEFQGKSIVLAGSPAFNFIVAYDRELDGELLSFEPTSTFRSLPIVMRDTEGNEWDIFGKAVSGPRKGQQLNSLFSTMGYWFAFSAFYEEVSIYNTTEVPPHQLPVSENSDWLIPFNQILDGGPGIDGIPALVSPDFVAYDIPRNIENDTYLQDDNLVVGVCQSAQLKLYPHPILDWHEIVNDEIEDTPYALIYCPLTGTTTVWDRDINGDIQEFGVSGFLFNSNIIPFDRATQSYWSQLYNLSVNGTNQGNTIRNYPHIETTWATWKRIAPTFQYLSEATGYSRAYDKYPYGSYRTNDNLLFPVIYQDTRLALKERVHAVVVDGKVKVYRFEHFK